MAVTVSRPPTASVLGAYFFRRSSSSVTSALSNWVTWGTTFQERLTLRAVAWRMPSIWAMSTGPHLERSGGRGGRRLFRLGRRGGGRGLGGFPGRGGRGLRRGLLFLGRGGLGLLGVPPA